MGIIRKIMCVFMLLATVMYVSVGCSKADNSEKTEITKEVITSQPTMPDIVDETTEADKKDETTEDTTEDTTEADKTDGTTEEEKVETMPDETETKIPEETSYKEEGGQKEDMMGKMVVEQTFVIPETEVFKMVADMKLGWNLGNTFDAIDEQHVDNDLDYETAWQPDRTTEEFMLAMKDAGFKSIRIPVSWHNHLEADGYTIKEAWLDRVKEVVDYCIDNDMYVILNIHHDNNKDFLYPTSEYLEQSVAYVTGIWKQLSEKFKDYDDKLIFEGMNEPRMVGHANEWCIDPDSSDCKDSIACINVLNQKFVDTVRASGGNNSTRYLMCPGYAAAPDGALNTGFVLPTDSYNDEQRIILTIHAYIPYKFALENPGISEWTSEKASERKEVTLFMDDLYEKFIKNGIPIIIDEFGVVDKNGNLESRVDFTRFYTASARVRGITCFWWDNNLLTGDGELFGIVNRKTGRFVYPDIKKALVEGADNKMTEEN